MRRGRPRRLAGLGPPAAAKLGAAGSRSLARLLALAGRATGAGATTGSGVGRARRPDDRFRRSSSAPVTTKAVARQNVPSAAISMIGIFFGKYGMFDTTAREMMRASAGAAAMLSRAVASRYLAR